MTPLLLLTLAAAPDFLARVPDVVARHDTPMVIDVDGLEVTQRSCVSKAGVEALKRHFAAAFAEAGLYVAPEQDAIQMASGDQITGLDVDHFLTYTAILQPSGKTTTVVMAVGDFAKRKPSAGGATFVPVPPSSAPATVAAFEGGRTMTFKTSLAPADVRAFYADVLPMQGLQQVEPDRYARGDREVTLTIAPGAQARTVMIIEARRP